MRIPQICRRVFAVLLIAIWGLYAAWNLISRAPYLKMGYDDGWDISSRVQGVIGAANAGVLFQDTFQNANARMEQLLGKKTSNDFLLVRGENGQYMYTTFYTYEPYLFNERALQLREVQKTANEQGASFLFVNCIDLYVDGIGDYGDFPVANLNPRSDAFLYALGGYGVEYLDARTTLAASSLSPQEYRYKTDPHWTVQASFEVYLGLLEKLKAQGVQIDPDGFYAKGENFIAEEYPGQYIGEFGKRMGIPAAQPEDFTLIVPDFETDFTMEYLEGDPHAPKEGDFSSLLLDERWLGNENPYERSMYSAYLTAEYEYRIIRNNLNEDGAKILLIGDSYMLPVSAFLAAAAGEVHLMWLYSLPDDAEDLLAYISDNGFDAVVVGMNPNALSGSGFNFLRGISPPKVDAAQQ